MNYTTKVGISIGDAQRPTHVAVVREPDTGALLRTKGRLYVLVEVEGGGHARDVAQDAATALRDEYYYDQSAGIDVSLRRAVLVAHRRARQRLRGGDGLHLACAVLCGTEAYTARAGGAEVLVVRHARLFVPGQVPGELTDYAYRAPTASSPPLGAEQELLVSVWRDQIELGDTIILGGARAAEGLGAEALKNATLTLHPVAAARHLHERFVAEGIDGAEALLIVEVSPRSTLAARASSALGSVPDDEAEEIAERIRESVESVWSRRPRIGRFLGSVAVGIVRPLYTVASVAIALVPRRAPPLPRAADVAAFRARRRQRVTAALAILLVLISTGVLALAYADYQEAQSRSGLVAAMSEAEREIGAARAAAEKSPPDASTARTRLERAEAAVARAAAHKDANPQRIAELRAQIAALREGLTKVVADLKTADPASAPVSVDSNVNGLYLADPGAGKVWRVQLDGKTGVVSQQGNEGMGLPRLVAILEQVVYAIDDQGRTFRYEGNARREVRIRDRKFREPVDLALFAGNLYVLDRAAGQVWKYEPSADGEYSNPAIDFLAQPFPPGVARSLEVDGEVWITTDDGLLHRFRRPSGSLQVSRVEFAVRWEGEPPRITQVLAKESQRSIYVLDAASRRVVQIHRDGRELDRVALPSELGEPIAFTVLEEQGAVISLHGTKLTRTDLTR